MPGSSPRHSTAACGIAAFTLMPSGFRYPDVEFKTNLLAPAKGQRFAFRASVVKPGRTLTVCEAGRSPGMTMRNPDRDHDRTLIALTRREAGEAAAGAARAADAARLTSVRPPPDAADSALGDGMMISTGAGPARTGVGRWSGFRSPGRGGGSILAVPAMVYVVGVPDAQCRDRTRASRGRQRASTCRTTRAAHRAVVVRAGFRAAGMVGAFAGSIFGKMLDGQRLLALLRC